MNCPLCDSRFPDVFFEKPGNDGGPRRYYKCPNCLLIFLDPGRYLGPEEEKRRYDQHRNHPENAGYVRSLQKLARPLADGLQPGSQGLDFGCGPQSVLKTIFEAMGHRIEIYDPFFHPDQAPLNGTYDFVACAETAEHFHFPAREFETLGRLTRAPGSRLGLMTQTVGDEKDFRDWWYHRDPTHVCFYRRETFEWIAARHRWTVRFPHAHVAIFAR